MSGRKSLLSSHDICKGLIYNLLLLMYTVFKLAITYEKPSIAKTFCTNVNNFEDA